MGLDPLDLIFRLEKGFGIDISRAEGTAVLFGTAGHIHRYLIAKLRGECEQIPNNVPLFMEVHRAVNRITGWWRLTSSEDLNRRFAPDTRAEKWNSLEEALGIPLPPLDRQPDEGFPIIPQCCDSIKTLTCWIAENHPDRVQWLPVTCEGDKMATDGWTEEGIWLALRECICDALGVDPEEVTYDANMVDDLGMN